MSLWLRVHHEIVQGLFQLFSPLQMSICVHKRCPLCLETIGGRCWASTLIVSVAYLWLVVNDCAAKHCHQTFSHDRERKGYAAVDTGSAKAKVLPWPSVLFVHLLRPGKTRADLLPGDSTARLPHEPPCLEKIIGK
jgi:hypothetical protein